MEEINNLISDLSSKEIDSYSYLCELIGILDKSISKEINDILISKDFEISEIEKRSKSSSGYNGSRLVPTLIIDILTEHKTAYRSWENIIWSSLFLSIYGSFESKLNQICFLIMEKDKIELSPNDLKDSGLTRAKKYLFKFAKYNFSISDDEWQLSREYNKVRNILIHNEGRLKKYENKYIDMNFYNFIESHSYLKIDGFDGIILTKDFVLETARVFCNIFITICKELVDDKR